MATLQVTCIRKRGDHYDPHERIQGIGGVGWFKAEDQAINDILTRTNTFYVSRGGRSVFVEVATHNGRRYLKTADDGLRPDNLLALLECR
jgi:hypothetical protein